MLPHCMLRNLSLFLWFGDSEEDFDKSNFLFFVEQILTLQTEKDEFLASWKLFFWFFLSLSHMGNMYLVVNVMYVCFRIALIHTSPSL